MTSSNISNTCRKSLLRRTLAQSAPDRVNKRIHSERKLAYVVKVSELLPIEGAKNIELARVLGWQCITKKGTFKKGNLAIYYEIDSVLDSSDPNFAAMAKRKFRLKTATISGTLSQGMLSPLSWLVSRGHSIKNLKEGDDVTKLMWIEKHLHSDEIAQYSNYITNAKRNAGKTEFKIPFPSFISKTDEPRLQSSPELLNDLVNRRLLVNCNGTKHWYENGVYTPVSETDLNPDLALCTELIVTRKEDGQSGTYFYCGGEVGICGRNFLWLKNVNDSANYFQIEAKYDMLSKLKKLGKNIAIQGEIVGISASNADVCSNRMKLNSLNFEVFNIWDIDEERYLDWSEVKAICAELGLATVPEIPLPQDFDFTMQSFLQLASSMRYSDDSSHLGEGIVVKTSNLMSECGSSTDYRVSFKVISNEYLEMFDTWKH